MNGPHQGQPLLVRGAALDQARAAMVLVHGRGDSAAGIMALAQELAQPDFVYLAPQAAGGQWYPNRFIAPLASNEPGLSSGLQAIADALARAADAGIPAERVILLGFSQGACLALEFAARNARRYGGVAGLSGGLIGPDGTPRDYDGSLAGTPVLLGCSDVDFHIPLQRVHEAAEVLGRLGAQVDERIYPGMGHTINQDELDAVQAMMGTLRT
jgi:phospholipase/carboxylesterase